MYNLYIENIENCIRYTIDENFARNLFKVNLCGQAISVMNYQSEGSELIIY